MAESNNICLYHAG